MGRLTDVQLKDWLRDAKATGKPLLDKTDGDGLIFRISAKGARDGYGNFGLRYRHGVKQSYLPIGRYPGLSLAEARKRAQRERVRVDDGVDVAADRRRARAAAKAVQSFAQLAKQYREGVASTQSLKTQKLLETSLRLDVLPRLGTTPIDKVTSGDVVAIVERVHKRSWSMARCAFRFISAIYDYGIAKGSCTHSPCVALKLSAIVGAPKLPRARVKLSEADLRAVLTEIDGRLSRSLALAIRIILATCVRKGELVRAEWAHLDLDNAIWHVPSELSKTREAFDIPLAQVVVEWFRELRSLAPHRAWVLPGRNPRMHIDLTTLNVALDRLNCDVRRFTPHDLRSTARSHLSRLGVEVVVAERCLNHTLGGMLAIYDRHDYLDERRRALELWADCLKQCGQPLPENVKALRAA